MNDLFHRSESHPRTADYFKFEQERNFTTVFMTFKKRKNRERLITAVRREDDVRFTVIFS